MKSFIKSNLSILLIGVTIAIFSGCSSDENKNIAVNFPDPALDEEIRAAIDKPNGPINESDLVNLEELVAYGKGISDLTGLQYCTKLKELNLDANQISDLSPISNLTNLNFLSLYENEISDITPLSGLNNLTTLCLYNNQISDISSVSGLTNLKRLGLAFNPISDISPVSGLIELESLVIWTNKVSDISALSDLTNLNKLALCTNEISDLSPLSELPNIRLLGLFSNQVEDIKPLADNLSFSAGDRIYLQENPLSTTSIDVYIPRLQSRGVLVLMPVEPEESQANLFLGNFSSYSNDVTDNNNSLGNRDSLDDSVASHCSGNLIVFPDPGLDAAIRQAIGKTSGDIYKSDLVGLEKLVAYARNITNLSGIECCIDLEDLNLNSNMITSILPLSPLTKLMNLSLYNNQISDLSPLSNLVNLTSLDLYTNKIRDLSPLSNLTNLKALYLSDKGLVSPFKPHQAKAFSFV
jgi:internalin A